MLEAMRLSDLVEVLSGRLVGADATFRSVSTDSRAIEPGQLFVALTGPRFDGHAYLAEVAGKGAVAALVERPVEGVALPQLVVSDSRIALGRLGEPALVRVKHIAKDAKIRTEADYLLSQLRSYRNALAASGG